MGLKCFRLLRGFIRVSTPSASHSNKSCWYTGYIHQIDLTITAPLSEVAYQLADTNSGDRTVIAKDIVKLNADVATAFGVFLSGVDIIL
jgi:hypothetical protein